MEYVLTGVIQMFSKLHISMATRCDVEVTLHFISIQTAKNTASILRAFDARRLRKLLLLLRRTKLIMHIPEFFPPRQSIVPLAQLMHSFLAQPLLPRGWILAEKVAGKRAVACGILHVYVEVFALHCDDDIEIDLQVVRYTFFYREGL
jgi:hypothetical protein